MDPSEQILQTKELMERVLDERITATQALDQLPDVSGPNSKLLDTVRWHLVYIQNDSDIIERDPEYRDMMFQTLKKLYNEVCSCCGPIGEHGSL